MREKRITGSWGKTYFLKDSKACLVSLYCPGAGAVVLGAINLLVVEPNGFASVPSACWATGRSSVDLMLYDPGPGTFFLSALSGISSWYLGIWREKITDNGCRVRIFFNSQLRHSAVHATDSNSDLHAKISLC